MPRARILALLLLTVFPQGSSGVHVLRTPYLPSSADSAFLGENMGTAVAGPPSPLQPLPRMGGQLPLQGVYLLR